MVVELAPETQFRFNQVFQAYPLTNQAIWLILTGAITRSRLDKPISEAERFDIMAIYKQTQPNNVPVDRLIKEAGVANVIGNQFLSKVCFNYEYELEGGKRLNKAIEDFNSGIGSELWSGMRGISYNAPEHWSFETWVEQDFDDMARERLIWIDTVYNRQKSEPEVVYGLLDRYDDKTRFNRIDKVFQQLVDNEFPLGRAGIGWWRYDDLQHAYAELLPLLRSNGLIKAGHDNYFVPPEKPVVILSSSD